MNELAEKRKGDRDGEGEDVKTKQEAEMLGRGLLV
jgi:hypothetical protein